MLRAFESTLTDILPRRLQPVWPSPGFASFPSLASCIGSGPRNQVQNDARRALPDDATEKAMTQAMTQALPVSAGNDASDAGDAKAGTPLDAPKRNTHYRPQSRNGGPAGPVHRHDSGFHADSFGNGNLSADERGIQSKLKEDADDASHDFAC